MRPERAPQSSREIGSYGSAYNLHPAIGAISQAATRARQYVVQDRFFNYIKTNFVTTGICTDEMTYPGPSVQ